MDRMTNTIRQRFEWPGVAKQIERFVQACAECKRYKRTATKKYDKIPMPDNVVVDPWHTIMIDMIGPWKAKHERTDGTIKQEQVLALTCVDKATLLMEAYPTRNKSSRTIALLFDREWLCRYPRPVCCIYDNGGEFTGM